MIPRQRLNAELDRRKETRGDKASKSSDGTRERPRDGGTEVISVNRLFLSFIFCTLFSFVCLFVSFCFALFLVPEGRSGMSDISLLSGISGLSFDSTLLSPLLFFPPSPVTLSILSFSACWSLLLNCFQ